MWRNLRVIWLMFLYLSFVGFKTYTMFMCFNLKHSIILLKRAEESIFYPIKIKKGTYGETYV